MIIDENYTGRHVRIVGSQDEIGLTTAILDAETGEMLEYVHRAEIVIDVKETNVARLHYYESGPNSGRILTDGDEPVTKEITVSVAEIDVTAFEVVDGD